MVTAVISHRRPRRKRASAWGWTSRRLGAIAVTILALAIATWLAPFLIAPPAAPPAAIGHIEMVVLPPAQPELIEVDVAADLAGAPHRTPRRAPRAASPLSATSRSQTDGYEILSAAELDGISQARN